MELERRKLLKPRLKEARNVASKERPKGKMMNNRKAMRELHRGEQRGKKLDKRRH